ncbi:choice-of-anchor I family protein [Algiphilus sp.]|uniref:choice-of-anchor I family protein n=1 Tax=Algiphilus sp. TaxID=1872431 RepID=UPI003B52BB14
MRNKAMGSVAFAAVMAMGLSACDGVNNRVVVGEGGGDGGAVAPGFELQLLHFADVDGAGGADDVRNFSALVDGFRSEKPNNTLLLSSGDNFIPGPEFFAAGDDSLADVLGEPDAGRANIAWLNALGVQASVVGNHDLDVGPGGLAELIASDGSWPGAQFPYLAANIDFSGTASDEDVDLAELTVADGQAASANSVAGSATIQVAGETIGIVGASVPSLPSITDTRGLTIIPAPGSSVAELAAAIQPSIDALTSQGINKIVLLAHMQQLAVERELATLLRGVDIIVAGGSNTILADSNDRLRDGDQAADSYPIELSGADGNPVLLVNTAGDFTYLGRLVVEFDADGVLDIDSIDTGVSGAYASDMLPNSSFSPIDTVVAITDALEAVLQAKDGNVLGFTEVYLDGRRSAVRTQETNLGNLTADANLWVAQQEDANTLISLKNGGGIRDDIGRAVFPPGSTDVDDLQFLAPAANPSSGKPAGGISQLDLETALRFNNGLTLLSVTAAELADIMEHAVSRSGNGATPGQFPQVSGLRFSFDVSRPARASEAGDTNQADPNINGDRLRNLAVVDDSGAVIDQIVADGMVVGDVTRRFRLVILDFIAKCVGQVGESCGDGYPLNGLSDPQRVDVTVDPGMTNFSEAGGEQDALAEYLLAFHPTADTAFSMAETAVADDLRIQNLAEGASDSVMTLPTKSVLNQIGRVLVPGANFDEGAAEIVAHDPGSQRLFVINSDAGTIDVFDFSNPANMPRIAQLDPVSDDTTTGVTLDGVNSVAVSSKGIVAAALEADPATDNGRIGFYDAQSLQYLGSIEAGPLPDMVGFTPDGNLVFSANEGETPEDANDDELRVFADDVPGSVTVADIRNGIGSATVSRVGFEDFNAGGSRAAELPAGVRINPNALSVAHDLEPEYITVSDDGTRAFVSLQENNAIGVIDLASRTVERIIGLGGKDHGLAANALDVSDDDGDCTEANPACINIRPWANVRGLYMPDTIDAITLAGQDFILTANEGDGRGDGTDECALKDQGDAGEPVLTLDPVAFPSASLTDDENLGELAISCDKIGGNTAFAGDTDGDGDLDEIRAFGARSMSIVNAEGGIVSDTGDDFERITAHLDRFGETVFLFNDTNDDGSPERDSRSDAKGPETEAVVAGLVNGRMLAFIGQERVGGIMVYDITNPRKPVFLDYVNNRDFTVSGEDLKDGVLPLDSAGDWGPEGLAFVTAADSPNAQNLLVVGNEITGTVTVYSVNLD